MEKLPFLTVIVALCRHRVGYPSEEVFREGKSRGEERPSLFFFSCRTVCLECTILHSTTASKAAGRFKHSPAEPFELSFVQIPANKFSDLNQHPPITKELGS